MVKIIENGQKTFETTCSRCGCKFSYQLEDLNYINSLQCPCCSFDVKHKFFNDENNNDNATTLPYTPWYMPESIQQAPIVWCGKNTNGLEVPNEFPQEI